MNYTVSNSNLTWELDEGMECLINIRHYIKEINISLVESDKDCGGKEFWTYTFSLQNLQQTYYIIELNKTHNYYCAKVEFTFSTKTSTNIIRRNYIVNMIPDSTDVTTHSSK